MAAAVSDLGAPERSITAETLRSSGKVAMSYLSSSLLLPQQGVQRVKEATMSWLEAERGGDGACREVRATRAADARRAARCPRSGSCRGRACLAYPSLSLRPTWQVGKDECGRCLNCRSRLFKAETEGPELQAQDENPTVPLPRARACVRRLAFGREMAAGRVYCWRAKRVPF